MESPTSYNVSVLLNALIERKGDPTDLTGTLKHIAQIGRMFLKASVCSIFAINPITHHLVASQTDPETILENNANYDQTQLEELIQRTFEEGSLLVMDLEEAPGYQYMHLENISSFVSLPLRIQHSQKPLGILCLYFKQQQFSLNGDDNKQQLFQIFSTQASFILQETWLLRRHQEVARIGQEINQGPSDITTLFEKLQKHTAGILDTSDALMLTVYEPQTNTLDLYLKEEGYPTYRKRWPLEGACEYVIKTQKPLFIRHLSEERKDLPFQPAYVTGTELEESLIYVPLVLHNVSLGVISIQHPTPRAYDQEDTFILQMLANHIALALYNIRLYSSLRLLNDTGQLLTQQPDSDQTLQATADKIRDSTKADIVVLYPYLHVQQRFVPPPYVAGKIQDPSTEQQMVPRRPDDIATLLLSREEPVFARESSTLYTLLMGDIHIRQGNFQQRESICSTAAARLKVGDELVGALFINFRQPQPFDGPQTLLIEGLSHFAAIAINNARMLDKVMQRRLHELEILQKIDREMNRNLELQSVLDTLIELTSEVIPAEEAAIMLYDPQTQFLETKSAIGSGAEARRKIKLHYASASGITRWVLEHKKPARVDNVRRDEPWRQIHISAGVDTTSELDVPLLDGEEMIGVLNFESSQEGAFSQEDENFLSTLAGQVVLALKKAQAYEREKRLAIERHALNEISKEIISQLDQQSIFKLILEKALELTRSNLGNLMLYDTLRKDLWVAAERNVAEDKKKQRQRLDQGIIGYVATTKRLLNVDVTQLPWKDIFLEYFPGAQSELAVPMLQGNEVCGVLNVESPIPNNFDKIDEELLTGLADLAVIVLRNAEQYETATLDARRFALLYKAGNELSNISEFEQLDQAYDSILRIAGEHCQGQLVIRQYNTEKQALELIRASHSEYAPPFPSMDLHEGINGQVARERHTIRIADTQNLSPGVGPVKLSDPEVRSLLITPIQFNERFYGTLGVSFREIGHFSKRDEQFFEGLAQQLASTIYRLEATQERRELERRNLALELMGSIGQSAFGLTHRLSRVLGVVPLMVDNIRGELEQQGHINKFVSERLDKIVSAAKTVLTLSNKLKSDIARTHDAEQTDTPVTIDPASILKEAESAVPLPSESSIQIHVEITPDVTSIHVIISSVIDILHNLIENAINAMPNGGIITLRAHNDGSYVALEVIDTGVGIPLDVQPYIFELFYSTKGSSGFGLWSARRNAYKNGGDLKVESQPGHGTKFTLLLPRAERNIGVTQ
jgi:GAF domain-containing protein